MDTHVIREGHEPAKGRFWGLVDGPGGDYGWMPRFRDAETFTAEQATELVAEFIEDGMACRAVEIGNRRSDVRAR
jgi:hypothetical protein